MYINITDKGFSIKWSPTKLGDCIGIAVNPWLSIGIIRSSVVFTNLECSINFIRIDSVYQVIEVTADSDHSTRSNSTLTLGVKGDR